MDVTLAPAGPDHAELWHVWRQEPVGLEFNPVMDLDLDEVRETLATVGSDLSDRSPTVYRWLVLADDEPVGMVGISEVSWRMGYGEVSYQIAAQHHRRGIGRRAVGRLVDMAFTTSDLRRLTATIASGNVGSRRLVESLGFVHEGTLREHFIIRGVPTDMVVYGILESEWRQPADRSNRGRSAATA